MDTVFVNISCADGGDPDIKAQGFPERAPEGHTLPEIKHSRHTDSDVPLFAELLIGIILEKGLANRTFRLTDDHLQVEF